MPRGRGGAPASPRPNRARTDRDEHCHDQMLERETSMRHRTKLLAGSAVAVALLAGALFGGVLAESPSAGSTAVDSPQAVSESALSETSPAAPRPRSRGSRRHSLPAPNNPDALASLGLAYQIRWRETGDSGYLPRSEAALRKALAASPHDPTATLGLGNLALIRHQFRRRPRRRAQGAHAGPLRGAAATASSVMPRSSSAATAPRSRRSSGWCRSSRASPRTRASPTPAS